MSVICPSITAYSQEEYRNQIEKIAHLAHRIQIDLTDGIFAKHKTVNPESAWWPVGFKADFHLMYKDPLATIEKILEHKPNLIIIHAEAEGDFNRVTSLCHDHRFKVGVALLPETPAQAIFSELENIDHALIFSGDLGNYGGHADLSLLQKAGELKQRKPQLEIGWDGGVNPQNVAQLILGGVDVLNVGGFIQDSEDPIKAYQMLERIADETGTT